MEESDEISVDIPQEQPIEQRLVPFHDDEIMAARGLTGIYVSVPSLCAAIGLDTNGQTKRMKNTKNLARGLRLMKLQGKRGVREVTCLRLGKVAVWLAGIETSRLKNQAIADKIDEYQENLEPAATQVFFQTFSSTAIVPAATVHFITRAEVQEVASFLQEHLDMSFGRIDDQLTYVISLLESIALQENTQDKTIAKIDQRTQGLSSAHKYTIKRVVDAIVIQGNVTYVEVYGPLKHRFRVTKYAEIADEQFDEVMAFLTELSQKLVSPEIPAQHHLF